MGKYNKDIAGYHILMILANSDTDFDPREGKVIVDYLSKNFPLGGNFDSALEEISQLSSENYTIHLESCASDFYEESSEQERYDFLDFAMKLVSADMKVVKEEDWMISRLYQAWDID